MNLCRSKQIERSEPGSFRLFAERIGMFLKPSGLHELDTVDREKILLSSVVVVDMSGDQPLVEAFRQIKQMSQRGKPGANIVVTKVHSEAQAKAVYNKLASLCENYLKIELQYLGGVPSDSLMRSIGSPSNDSEYHQTVTKKHSSSLGFIEEYWQQTHPLMAVKRS